MCILRVPEYRLVEKQSRIQRLQGKFINESYDDTTHSYRVLHIFMDFCDHFHIKYDSDDIKSVMYHDILEVESTDLPYTVKKISKEVHNHWIEIEKAVAETVGLQDYTDDQIEARLSPVKHTVFKLADMLELQLFLFKERSLGNTTFDIGDIIDRAEGVLEHFVSTFENRFDLDIVKFLEKYL